MRQLSTANPQGCSEEWGSSDLVNWLLLFLPLRLGGSLKVQVANSYNDHLTSKLKLFRVVGALIIFIVIAGNIGIFWLISKLSGWWILLGIMAWLVIFSWTSAIVVFISIMFIIRRQ